MRRKLLPFALITFLAPATVHAQIAFGGAPIGTKAAKLGLPAAPVVRMPHVDVAALMAEDEAQRASGVKGPYRFGFNHTVDLGLENSGTWSTMPDGTRLWRLGLECPGAYSINFVFGEYTVPEGARVFVYNEAGEHLGGFTAASNGGAHSMGVTQLAGDRITIEYQEPAAVAGQGNLRITQVTHAYRDVVGFLKDLGDSGSCNNNVICPEGDNWRDEIAAVAMITVNGSGLCTGTLLNDCAQDGTPYFLTANHCTQGMNPNNWMFRFKWESPTCTPTTNGPANMTLSGASLLYNNGGSDVALLQLNTTPPADYAVYYAGWDASGAMPENQTCIHHPSGDIKKISFDYNSATQGAYNSAQCWHILQWDDGTTEPGSSGSGLWDQNHHIIGQLFGGQAQCANNVNDYFGRFDVSYPALEQWLGNCTTLDGYDPNSTPLGLDAQLFGITGADGNLCDQGTITPSITIKNVGTTPLTSVTYNYDLDNGPATAGNWTGLLNTGSTATIDLGPINVTNGTHTLHVSCSAPNGGADENPNNDALQRSFFVANPGHTVTLHITTDQYGSETTWQVMTQGGNEVLFSGGPYQDSQSTTEQYATMCLGTGCYDLHMSDAYGDGICCGYGNGDYEVLDADNTVLLNGDGAYGTGTVNSFCVSGLGIAAPARSGALRVYPDPGQGLFYVTLPESATSADLTVFDATGRRLLQRTERVNGTLTLDLTALPEGTYALTVSTGGERYVQRVMIAR